jgi:hypothetical protein
MFRHFYTTSLGFLAILAGSLAVSAAIPARATAMTAHGTDKKTLVTVPLEAGMEAVVALDHVTCELTGYVLDRFTGKFFVQYRYNVANDFAVRRGEIPGFLMVAGQADFRQFTGNERIADGLVYVSEEDSGQVVAYAIPWNTQFRTTSVSPQRRPFLRLDAAKTRFVELREQ